MYKILVCDDEKWIRKGVIKKIENFDLPVLSALEACNIDEAKTIIEKESPQIVIADICIGDDCGLDLIRETAEAYPDIRFIIISGYSEFNYAERAIRLGVDAYILKPIIPEELEQAVKRSIEKYENNRKAVQDKTIRSELLWQNRKYKTEIIFNQIFRTSNYEYQKQLAEQAKKNSDGWKKYSRCILLQVEESSYVNSSFSKQETELLKYGIENIVLELAENRKEFIEIIRDIDHPQRLIIIDWNDDFNNISLGTIQFATQILYVIRQELSISLTIAISLVHNDINKEMYVQAQKAMHNKFLDGVNRVYVYPNDYGEQNAIKFPYEHITLLEHHIQKNDVDGAKEIVNELFLTDKEYFRNSEYTFCVYLSVLNVILKCSERAIYIFNNSKDNFMNLGYFERFENSGQIANFIVCIIEDVCGLDSDETITSSCKGIMDRVKDYIDVNYMNKITLTDLAKLFNINYSYFSTIFKEQVGVSLTQYLRKIRIEKACSMLKAGEANINLIANCVGFDDTMYFYRVFKKCKGMTPTEYRKSIK